MSIWCVLAVQRKIFACSAMKNWRQCKLICVWLIPNPVCTLCSIYLPCDGKHRHSILNCSDCNENGNWLKHITEPVARYAHPTCLSLYILAAVLDGDAHVRFIKTILSRRCDFYIHYGIRNTSRSRTFSENHTCGVLGVVLPVLSSVRRAADSMIESFCDDKIYMFAADIAGFNRVI